jgi:predicted tellurium resistance membrane protein TerC
MEWIVQSESWLALITLLVLEIILGIDNIVFISITVNTLPPARRNRARLIGLGLAMFMRIVLLLSLTWVLKLTAPLFTLFSEEISWRDLILIGGGLFLLVKSTREIHSSLEEAERKEKQRVTAHNILGVLIQITLIDIIFSLDSVITAIGMAQQVEIMIIAIVGAVLVMMFASRPIGEFVEAHPTIKMLALSFLILIGVAIIAEGLDLHLPRGYIYFAMAFSFMVELLNMKVRGRRKATTPA